MSRKGGTRARDQKTLSHFQDALISTLLSLYRLAPTLARSLCAILQRINESF